MEWISQCAERWVDIAVVLDPEWVSLEAGAGNLD